MLVVGESSARQAYAILVYKVAEVFAVAVVYGLRHILAVGACERCEAFERKLGVGILERAVHDVGNGLDEVLLAVVSQVAALIFHGTFSLVKLLLHVEQSLVYGVEVIVAVL